MAEDKDPSVPSCVFVFGCAREWVAFACRLGLGSIQSASLNNKGLAEAGNRRRKRSRTTRTYLRIRTYTEYDTPHSTAIPITVIRQMTCMTCMCQRKTRQGPQTRCATRGTSTKEKGRERRRRAEEGNAVELTVQGGGRSRSLESRPPRAKFCRVLFC